MATIGNHPFTGVTTLVDLLPYRNNWSHNPARPMPRHRAAEICGACLVAQS